ncbi:exodeoxyribonuclease V subunit beta [Porphyromonas sp. COT-239 OH1446]|uniref:UvrD-helicase domain-containing protein n=1 Tax=Porphyromonas sp. COT-239 OH1446 TaxID=1515613 RepID=UPI00052BEC8D|nr:UvrD-helicase domain-containing protein [Porphyromonas sp. COT-239 OH1446]KGN72084.1 hypothetical protein HQ37_00210 [Porphyromonas sp. COT-239 OH1446]
MSTKPEPTLINDLSVYVASAGAGKTHTLTGEYLRLALEANFKFRNIQAVTFTNKATTEMKERIIRELALLAHSPESSSFADMLLDYYPQLSIQDLGRRARRTLRSILLDYKSFRVRTIDAFFQEVLRGFARELGFSSSYRLNIEADQALSEAVTALLVDQDLGVGSSEVGQWLKRLASELSEQGRSVDLRRKILSLGRELHREGVQRLSSQSLLPSREELKNLDQELQERSRTIEEHIDLLCKGTLELVEQAGLEIAHFYQGPRGGLSPFIKWVQTRELTEPNSYFRAMLEDESKVVSGAGKKAGRAGEVLSLYHHSLRGAMQEYADHYLDYGTMLRSLQVARKHLGAYGLISDIDAKIKELHLNEHAILLADTASFIYRILQWSDAPFIYEKLGVKLEHIMIDEFQDTSSLQYENFKPLLEESLASGHSSLVVGDVKQSIYRWRNSDSSLLSHRIDQDFESYVRRITLGDNWRSARQIVAFNNALYPLLSRRFSQIFEAITRNTSIMRTALSSGAEQLVERLLEFSKSFERNYADVVQSIPPSREQEGQVVLHRCLDLGEPLDDEDAPLSEQEASAEWDDNLEDAELIAPLPTVLDQLPGVIVDLKERGYRASDIAILVRGHREANLVGQKLLEEGLLFVSAEALRLENAHSVRLILAAMEYITDSLSARSKRILLELYVQMAQMAGLQPRRLEREDFIEILYIGRQSLYEVISGLYAYFSDVLPESELPYQIKMLDMAQQMQRDRVADVQDFLEMWQEEGHKALVVLPPNEDALQLMTIHKSKGLGFEVVLLPFVDWSLLGAYPPMLWTSVDLEPFNRVEAIPMTYNSELLNTYFASYYLEESVDQALDALNLLYVATTRAKRELHLWAIDMEHSSPRVKNRLLQRLHGYEEVSPEGGRARGTGKTIQSYLNEALEQIPDSYHLLPLSSPIQHDQAPRCGHAPEREQEHLLELRSISSFDVQGRISILREGLDYFREDSPRRHGRVMHSVLSEIETEEDIASALEDALYKGWISERMLPPMHEELRALVNREDTARWFSSEQKILRELPIIAVEIEGSRRPDRIVIYADNTVEVIDYKFGVRRRAHHRQVEGYVALLEQMGYRAVRGYLWYVNEGAILSV